jgi:O-antigen ligase
MQTTWRRYAILTALVVFPLLYGTVHPFPVLSFQLCAYFLFGWWAIDTYRTSRTWDHLNDPLLRIGALALGLGLLQLIPLPVPVLAYLSPGTYDLVTLQPETGLESFRWHSLAVVPWAVEQGVLWLAALIAWYAVLQAEVKTRRGAVAVARTIAAAGIGLAFIGLFQEMSGTRSILWLGLERPQFYATYINPNNAAGALTIATLACLASASVTARKSQRPLWYAGALICATSAMFSLSRAGVVVLIFALLITAFWTHRASQGEAQQQSRTFVPLALIGATVLLVAWIGSTELLGEFEKVKHEGQNLNGRTDIWKVALLSMFPDYPLFGAGFGNFPEVFPVYQEGPVRVHIQAAENEYLQALLEGGLAGALLVGWALAILGKRIRQTVQSARRMGLGIPFAAALSALMLHMLVDFPLHVGGAALWIVVGVAMVSRPAASQLSPSEQPQLQR